jgi:aminopeptidase N
MIEKRAIYFGLLFAFFLPIGMARGQSKEDYRAPADRPIDILHIALDLDVSLQAQSIQGKATMEFQPHREVSSFTLDAVDLKVTEVRELSDEGEPGKTLAFESTGKGLEIRFDQPLAREQKKRIEISPKATAIGSPASTGPTSSKRPN